MNDAPSLCPPVRVMRLPDADRAIALPTYRSAGAAGADLCANLDAAHREAGLTLAPMARALVPTGLAMAIPVGWEMQIRPRSGLALSDGVTVVNTPATIDCDYRGPVGIIVINLGAAPVTIAHGQRIAQAVLSPAPQAIFVAVDALQPTARGQAGFGSTGKGA